MEPGFVSETAAAPGLLALHGALALYFAAAGVALVRPSWGRVAVAGGFLLHLGAMGARGVAIGFLPLTNKMESFSAASLALAGVVVLFGWSRRRWIVPLVVLAWASLGAALAFPTALAYPPPLMRTAWYPAHVPLSFTAYALWASAAAAGLVAVATGDPTWHARVQRHALQGFGLWSLSMVCGGVWGVLAWGAWWLWDPKVIWSAILWFWYALFVHVRYAPSLAGRAWVRPVLAWIGFGLVLVAYVGTSFFFGRSSHAW